MIDEYKSKGNKFMIIGFFVLFAGSMLQRGQYPALGILVVLVGVGLFTYGCVNYAKGKGQHWTWGLLGILPLLGLIVVTLLPDKYKKKK